MKIVFKSISVQNFKSIGKQIKFDFASHSGLNYIIGRNLDLTNADTEEIFNGVGKSNLFTDALLYGLYGKPLKNIVNSNIPNRTVLNEYPTEIIVEFETGGKQYRVITSIVKKSSVLKLFCDTVDITKSSINVTRKYLEEEILKCPYELFKNSIVISSSDKYNFFEMNKSQRREYIESVFNLGVFGEMLKNARADLNSNDRELICVESEINSLNSNILTYKEKEKDFDNNKIKQMSDINSKLKTAQSQLQLYSNNTVKMAYSAEDTARKQKLDSYQAGMNELSKISGDINKCSEAVRQYENEKKSCEREINLHSAIFQLVCLECNSRLKEHYNVPSLQTQILKLENNIKVVNEASDKLKKKYDSKQTEYENFDMRSELVYFNKLTQEINNNINSKKVLERDILSLSNEYKKVSGTVSSFGELISNVEETLLKKRAKRDECVSLKAHLEILCGVYDENGVKKLIIHDLVETLNSIVKNYLFEMRSNYTVEFDDSFDYKFLTDTGECEYYSFSRGERQRINIAVLFAFRHLLSAINGINSNIFILDEIIDEGIDPFAVKSVLGILKKFSIEEKQTIFLISHKAEVKTHEGIDNVIEIVKQNNQTFIQLDNQAGKQ